MNDDRDASEPEYRVVWDSSNKRNKTNINEASTISDVSSAAVKLKEQGNVAFKSGKFAAALAIYKQAIQQCKIEGKDTKLPSSDLTTLEATLYSNWATTALRLGRPSDAATAAKKAHALRPKWTKPLHRLAEALLACGEFPAAVSACKHGESLCTANSEGHTEFTPLLDKLAIEAALKGRAVGFTGRKLEVRSAGDDAWLGRPAPHVPSLDGPLTEETALPSDDLSKSAVEEKETSRHKTPGLLPSASVTTPSKQSITDSSAGTASISAREDGLATWHYSDAPAVVSQQRTSFRSIREAVAAARDGDRIVLLRGVHNGMGEAIDVKKRLLIEGEGSLGETVIDQRANVPTFRISRGGVVIRNLDLDHTGFREAVLVEGSASVYSLIDGCIIKCSGDDAVNVAGNAAPYFRQCVITGKKTGIRAFDRAKITLEGCIIEKCGEQGVKLMEKSKIDATLCTLRDCEEEGVVVMDNAAVSLLACTVTGNKGPGVDCSGNGVAEIRGGDVAGNVGGVWLWDDSSMNVDGVRLDGGRAPVILSDGNGRPKAKSCVIKGTIHAPDVAWAGLLGDGGQGAGGVNNLNNRLEDPDVPTDFPPEEGPFRFVPNRYTRKQ